ncbi:MAG: triose-phosphate isomerase [Oligosphaeraceae bacterium]|nr:triose-phosphate isomerase [Oligosphaeraceae bacterium]
MSRCKLIAGNWKMNQTASQAGTLIQALKAEFPACNSCCSQGPDVLVFPPFTSIAAVLQEAGTCLQVGAQNVHWASSGAYTGEISTAMLKELGVSYVLIGHSERRQYFGESDETVNRRLHAALKAGLKAVVCIGETEQERQLGLTNCVLEHQLRWGLNQVSATDMQQVVIAYEPVWAIGTGKTASNADAQAAHAFIRSLLGTLYGQSCAEAVRILYGGSMNAGNAAGLLAQPDIDGGLIGGASLKPADFASIIRAAKQ